MWGVGCAVAGEKVGVEVWEWSVWGLSGLSPSQAITFYIQRWQVDGKLVAS